MQLQVMHEGQQVGTITVEDSVAKGRLSRKSKKTEQFTGKSGGVAYDVASIHVVVPGGKVQIGRATRPAVVTVWKA
mgnify:CR=1 FL=1